MTPATADLSSISFKFNILKVLKNQLQLKSNWSSIILFFLLNAKKLAEIIGPLSKVGLDVLVAPV